MPDSETIGALCVLTLILAADAADRGIPEEATRTAYRRLREKIRQCLNDEEPLLEQLWLSTAMRARVSLAIEQSYEHREKVKKAAVALIEALKADVLRGALGISLRRLETIRANLEAIR